MAMSDATGWSWQNLLLAICSPVVFLLLIELTLFILGVEPKTQEGDPFVGFSSYAPLFVEDRSSSTSVDLVTAPNKRGFFNLQRFPRETSEDTYRILCLGGSTTYGRPYDDRTSFTGWLREILPEVDPSRHWEVINAGGISYASYRIARLVEELVKYSPDLFVIYTGHNEFLEERTYGQIRDLPAPIKGAVSILSSTRIWAALDSLVGSGASKANPSSANDQFLLPDQVAAKLDHSAGLDLYERDDGLRDGVLNHFRVSLERMIDAADSAGAKVILVKPASNLKDFSPFKSQPSDGLSDGSRLQSVQAVSEAQRNLELGHPSEALSAVEQALRDDQRNADLHFMRGRALLDLGRTENALAALERARDEDVCSLRALSSMQAIVSEVARKNDVPLVDFVDLMATATEQATGHAIAGQEYFLDHVHPTIDGHKILAVAIIEEMIRQGTLEPVPDWKTDGIDPIAERIQSRIDRDFQARGLANLSLTLNWAGKNELSRRLAFQALEMGSEDPTLLMMVARHYALSRETRKATEFFRKAVRANPTSPVIHSQIGLFLFGLGDLDAATAHFFLATALWPDNPTGHSQLGLALSRRGRPDLALLSYEEALRLNPTDPSTIARVQTLRAQLAARSLGSEPRKMAVLAYPSTLPRRLYQAIQREPEQVIADGIWTEWFESGLPRFLREYREGRVSSPEIEWSEQGDRLPNPDDG